MLVVLEFNLVIYKYPYLKTRTAWMDNVEREPSPYARICDTDLEW